MYKFALIDETNLNETARIQAEAYPGIRPEATLEQRAEGIKTTHNRPDVNFYGVFREADNKMVGSFNIWDFEMNMRGAMIKSGGVGSVAVDLGHKKEKVARELMRHYLDILRDKGVSMAMLYPFNSAFYHKMGFGFGTLLHQFRIKPEDLPGNGPKDHVVRLGEGDAEELTKFYNLRVAAVHGLISKSTEEFATRLKSPALKIFAHVDDGIRGYIAFSFRKGSDESVLVNDMVITEMLFDSPKAFKQLMAFVKSQSDQVRYVIINTQDEGFVNTVTDPRNHMERLLHPVYQEICRTGLGIMYRICHMEKFFADIAACRFGDLNIKLKVNLSDSFVPQNNRPFLLEFSSGLCKLAVAANGEADAELTIDIAEFSSLIMGCVNLTSLVKFGLATLTNHKYLAALSQAFATNEKPLCLTYF